MAVYLGQKTKGIDCVECLLPLNLVQLSTKLYKLETFSKLTPYTRFEALLKLGSTRS